MTNNKISWLLCLVIVIAAVIANWYILKAPFWSDDYLNLDTVTGKNLIQSFFHDSAAIYFYPIARQVRFWSVVNLIGDSPIAFHILSLIIFSITLILFFILVKEVANPLVAIIALIIVAFHSATKSPLLWISANQEILGIIFALLSLLLIMRNRLILSIIVFFIALCCRTTIVLLPIIILFGFKINWKKLTPFIIAIGVYSGLWGLQGTISVINQRFEFNSENIFALPIQYLRAFTGLESPVSYSTSIIKIIILIGVLICAYLLLKTKKKSNKKPYSLALTWIVCGIAPVFPVLHTWSSQDFLFPIFGGALLVAMLIERRLLLTVVVTTLLFVGSQSASSITTFSQKPDCWKKVSAINKYRVERGMQYCELYNKQLLEQVPNPPSGSVFYFMNLPAFIGWQMADGYMIRHLYKDKSLKSYYMGDINRHFNDKTITIETPLFLGITLNNGDNLLVKRVYIKP